MPQMFVLIAVRMLLPLLMHTYTSRMLRMFGLIFPHLLLLLLMHTYMSRMVRILRTLIAILTLAIHRTIANVGHFALETQFLVPIQNVQHKMVCDVVQYLAAVRIRVCVKLASSPSV